METKNFKTIFLPYNDKLGKSVEIKKGNYIPVDPE